MPVNNRTLEKKNRWMLVMAALTLFFLAFGRLQAHGQEEETDIYFLKISYYLEDTAKPIAPAYEATLPKGESYEVKSPEIEGYSLKDDSQSLVKGRLEDETEIQVFYQYASLKAEYSVEYYGQSIDGEEVVLLERMEGEEEIGKVITVPDKIFTGYEREPSNLSLEITADGNALKKLYYTKKVNPCILFDTQGTEAFTISEAPGTDIREQLAKITAPTRQGYEFDGWDQELPTEMPAEDLIIHAKWTPGRSSYTVLHWFQNVEGEEYTLNSGENETRMGVTESWVTATQEDEEKANTAYDDRDNPYFGFDYSHADRVTVQGDGKTVLNIYYDREIWTVRLFDNPLQYNVSKDEYESFERILWKSFRGRYGAEFPADYPSVTEMQEHYSALNPWTEDKLTYVNLINADKTVSWPGTLSHPTFFSQRTFTEESGNGTHILDAFPFYAKKTTTFNIFFYGQSLDGQGYELVQTKIANAELSSAQLKAYPPEGFTFEGSTWRTDRTQADCEAKEWSSGLHVYEEGYVYPRVYAWAEFRMQRVKNDIIFISNGAEVGSVSEVFYEKPLEEQLKFVPENGEPYMKFAGWYINPELFDLTDPVTSMTMPATDLKLYAKWEPIDCTVTFDFRNGSGEESQPVERGKYAVPPEEPERENYTFAGWYTGEGVRWNFSRQVTEDITLYGLWKPILTKQGYTVSHLMRDGNTLIAQYSGTGFVGDTVAVQSLNAGDEDYVSDSYIVPDALTKSITLTQEGSNQAVFYYDVADLKDYTVSYYLEGTQEKIREDKVVKSTKLNRVTELSEKIPGYRPLEKYKIADLSMDKENKISFYYELQVPVTALDSSRGAGIIMLFSSAALLGAAGFVMTVLRRKCR